MSTMAGCRHSCRATIAQPPSSDTQATPLSLPFNLVGKGHPASLRLGGGDVYRCVGIIDRRGCVLLQEFVTI